MSGKQELDHVLHWFHEKAKAQEERRRPWKIMTNLLNQFDYVVGDMKKVVNLRDFTVDIQALLDSMQYAMAVILEDTERKDLEIQALKQQIEDLKKENAAAAETAKKFSECINDMRDMFENCRKSEDLRKQCDDLTEQLKKIQETQKQQTESRKRHRKDCERSIEELEAAKKRSWNRIHHLEKMIEEAATSLEPVEGTSNSSGTISSEEEDICYFMPGSGSSPTFSDTILMDEDSLKTASGESLPVDQQCREAWQEENAVLLGETGHGRAEEIWSAEASDMAAVPEYEEDLLQNLEEALEELKKNVTSVGEILASSLEQTDFYKHMNPSTSSIPSGKAKPWDTKGHLPVYTDSVKEDTGKDRGEESPLEGDSSIKPVEGEEETLESQASFVVTGEPNGGVLTAAQNPGEKSEEECVQEALHDPNKSLRPITGRGSGKPVGGKGGGRTFTEGAILLDTIYCDPEECTGCTHYKECQNTARSRETRNVEDIEITVYRQPYVVREFTCTRKDGEVLSGKYPLDVNSSINIGPALRALCVALNTVGMVSYRRISDIVTGFTGVSVSHKSIENWVKQTASRLRPVMDLVAEMMLTKQVAYCDETGVRIHKVLHWIHTFCDQEYTYLYVDRKRGQEGMKNGGLLPCFSGTVVSDCWGSYWAFPNIQHGLCNAHLLRELNALVVHFKKDSHWAKELMELLREMDHERNLLKENGINHFDEETLKNYDGRYDKIVSEGMSLHPEKKRDPSDKKRGRVAQGKARCLLNRLKEHKKEFLMFLTNFQVEFTNNTAEQSFRMVSQKRSVIGGFETMEGAEDFVTIWSFVSTAVKHGNSAYDAIYEGLLDRGTQLIFDEEAIKYLHEMKQKRIVGNRTSASEELYKEAEHQIEKKPDAA